MKITKLGHCCLLIEEKNLRILTDPGFFTQHYFLPEAKISAGQAAPAVNLDKIHIVLFSHEHPDHFHLESLKVVLEKNPQAKIITNSAVGKLLGAAGIQFETLEHGQFTQISGVLFDAYGSEHAEIYDLTVPRVQNTGYLISSRLFYPGDSLTMPEKQAEILALPTAGPWIKTKEAIDYAKAVSPKKCFPVHDAVIKDQSLVFYNGHPQKALQAVGIEMVLPELGKMMEF